MKPTDVLKTEHKAVKLVLEILEKVIRKLKAKKVDHNIMDHFSGMLNFLKIFVDKCHHGKEEDLLFPEILKAGFPLKDGPIETMLKEHNEGRGYVKAMAKAFAKYKKGDLSAGAGVVENAKKYIKLLRQHIEKEDNIVFNIADHYIPAKRQDKLVKDFERLEVEKIGLGTHEKFHDMIYELKKIYLK